MKQDVILVVLAAGSGKRFWPFSTDKISFPFIGKPLISHVLPESLPSAISRCVIVANAENADLFASMKLSVPHDVVIQKEPNGMAGAVMTAKELLKNSPILISIADDLANPLHFEEILSSVKPETFGILTAFKPVKYFPGGYIAFSQGRPVGIVEKPGAGKTPSEYVYFGGQYFRDAMVLADAIRSVKSKGDDVYEQALTSLMKTTNFGMVPYEDDFVSMKYPWHVLDVMSYLFRHRFTPSRGKHVDIRNNVSIEGPVHIGNNVKIFENTKIVGPAYIGDHTIIGNNNIIRDCYIGENCVTGFNTDITRSYVGDDCWFHSNFVGDSVLEGNVSMGSGTVLANLRLDEGEIHSAVGGVRTDTYRTKLGTMIGKDVRIGVNASIMPGVKIGTNSQIGAGAIVLADVPDNSFCIASSKTVIVKNTKTVHRDRSGFKSKI